MGWAVAGLPELSIHDLLLGAGFNRKVESLLSPEQAETAIFHSCSFLLQNPHRGTAEAPGNHLDLALAVTLLIDTFFVGWIQNTDAPVPLLGNGYHPMHPAIAEYAVIVIVVAAHKNTNNAAGMQAMEHLIHIGSTHKFQIKLLGKGWEIDRASGSAPLICTAVIRELTSLFEPKLAVTYMQAIGDHHCGTKRTTGFCNVVLQSDLAPFWIRICAR